MMKRTLITIIGVVTFLPGLQAQAADHTPQELREKLAYSIGVQAYIYAYPMMDLWRTFYEGTLDPKRGHTIGLNQFNFSRKLGTPKDDWVVVPNNDTVYNRAFLDLTTGPMVLSVPDTGGRHHWFPVGDIYHNMNASISWDTVGFKGGDCALVPPGWKGVLPDKVERVEVRTPMMWTLGRYSVSGPDDVPEANALQDKTLLRPLSVFRGKKALPQPDAASYPEFTRDDLSNARKFFTTFNEIQRRNPPLPTDGTLISLFGEIGLDPAQHFGWEALPEETQRGLERAVTITLSATEPEDPKARANWLPTPKGAFYMALREYTPDAAILSRGWEPPGVKRDK